MRHFTSLTFLRPCLRRMADPVLAMTAMAAGLLLQFGVCSPAGASAQLFAAQCSYCHNDIVHPQALVYNAAGNPALVEKVNALGMGALGTPTDHSSIAAYLDTIRPSITLEPVAHNSTGTTISLWDIIVSASTEHAFLKVIERIQTVTPPQKGTVTYRVANGYARPTIVTYRPFVGQSGVDTWTYQGVGSLGSTTVRTASVLIDAGADAPAANYQGLWWAAPGGSEAGWGINFAHQGDMIFATWFTYDANGKAWWLSMTAAKTGAATYAGKLFETRGPAFSAVPFDPARVQRIEVGEATLSFADANSGTFSYSVGGIAQTKPIARQVFGALPACAWLAQPDFAAAANYQDLWWVAAGAESGWGVNLTHQGDNIFATWFTYDVDGRPLWLSFTAAKAASGSYTGDLIRTAGPAFNAVPFDPARVTRTVVGTATLTFQNGNAATFAYTVNGVAQSKAITRELFAPPAGTLCR